MSIKGGNSVANSRKMRLYKLTVDLVNDNVCTKFGQILSIPSQDIEQIPNFDVNQGSLLCCKIAKKTFYNPNVDLSMKMCIKNLVSIIIFVLKILNENRVLTSINAN